MDQVCAAFPVLPGKADAARSFMRELETQRKAQYDRSERRIGITKEVWYLAQLPSGDHLVGYITDFGTSGAGRRISYLPKWPPTIRVVA
jgi:hypothetical protein